jgi:hypothetical protein
VDGVLLRTRPGGIDALLIPHYRALAVVRVNLNRRDADAQKGQASGTAVLLRKAAEGSRARQRSDCQRPMWREYAPRVVIISICYGSVFVKGLLCHSQV